MAIGALQALRAAGLACPDDVAVAGFDDIPLARHLGLTTVRVRIAELGERAFERLSRARRAMAAEATSFTRPSWSSVRPRPGCREP